MKPELQAALQVVKEACAAVNTNLTSHQNIQTALRQIEFALVEQAEPPEKPKKKET